MDAQRLNLLLAYLDRVAAEFQSMQGAVTSLAQTVTLMSQDLAVTLQMVREAIAELQASSQTTPSGDSRKEEGEEEVARAKRREGR